MTRTNLANNTNIQNVSTVTTSSITPANGSLLVVSVGNNHDNISTNVPTVSGLSLTFTQIATQGDSAGTQGERVTMFYALVTGSPSGTLTIDFAGQSQSNIGYSIEQVIGADITGVNGVNGIIQHNSSSVNGSSHGISLTALANPNNIVYAAFANGGGSSAAGAGFTAITVTANRFFAEYGINQNPATYTFVGPNDSSGMAIEIGIAKSTGAFFFSLL